MIAFPPPLLVCDSELRNPQPHTRKPVRSSWIQNHIRESRCRDALQPLQTSPLAALRRIRWTWPQTTVADWRLGCWHKTSLCGTTTSQALNAHGRACALVRVPVTCTSAMTYCFWEHSPQPAHVYAAFCVRDTFNKWAELMPVGSGNELRQRVRYGQKSKCAAGSEGLVGLRRHCL